MLCNAEILQDVAVPRSPEAENELYRISAMANRAEGGIKYRHSLLALHDNGAAGGEAVSQRSRKAELRAVSSPGEKLREESQSHQAPAKQLQEPERSAAPAEDRAVSGGVYTVESRCEKR